MSRPLDRLEPRQPSAVILVVDGDEAARGAHSALLQDAGYGVLVVGDRDSALEVLEREGVDLVLLDGDVLEPSSIRDGATPVPAPEVAPSSDNGGQGRVAEPVDGDELLASIRARLRDLTTYEANLARLRARAAVAGVIVAAADQGGRSELGQRVCDCLAARCTLEGTMIVAFTGTSALRVLGSHGLFDDPDVRVPIALPEAATRLRDHISRGPSLVDPEGGPLAFEAVPRDVVVAVAPIASGARLLGALLLAKAESADPWAARTEALATAAEFAGVAAGVFGGLLEAKAVGASRRRWVHRVLEPGALTPHFQPIVELATNRTTGYEALTRWHDHSNPEEVLAEAHALGVGDEVEVGLARAAIEHAKDLPRSAYLALNFSLSTLLTRPDLALLLPHDRPTVIEISENERVDDYEALRRALERLGPLVGAAVDDAGAGYASLRHILAVRPRSVKLDIFWITDISADPARQAVLAGLVHFANRLGCCLVAEGIERQDELLALKQLGITHGQGRLLGRPSPASAYVERPSVLV